MRTVSSPLIVGSRIIGSTGSGGGGNYVVAVDPTATPAEAYRVTSSAPYVPTSVACGDLVFLWSDKGIVTCIRADDGHVFWRERVGGEYSSSPVRAGDQVLALSDEGEVVVVAATEDYHLIGKVYLGSRSRATPAVDQHGVYFRTESELMHLPAKSN